MKKLFLLLFLAAIASSGWLHSSSTRLAGMSAPAWALEDDSESVNLSPALITRFGGSALMIDLSCSLSDQSSSNENIFGATTNLNYGRNYSHTFSGQFAYLNGNTNFSYGVVLNPSVNFNGQEYVHQDNSIPVDYMTVSNAFLLNPVGLSFLFGFRLFDSFTLGFKPTAAWYQNFNSMGSNTNGAVMGTNIGAEGHFVIGTDAGLNFSFGGNLVGVIWGISFIPLQYYDQATNEYISWNVSIIGETGAFKWKLGFYQSSEASGSSTFPNEMRVESRNSLYPVAGIAIRQQLTSSIIAVAGASFSFLYYSYVYSHDLDVTAPAAFPGDETLSTYETFTYTASCFAGIEARFLEQLTGRFGLAFTAFNSYTAKSSFKDYLATPIISYNPDYYTTTILGNWRLTSGLTYYPLKNFQIDILWGISPFLSGGWNDTGNVMINSSTNSSFTSTPTLQMNLSLSATFKF